MQMIHVVYGQHYNITRIRCETADAGHSGAARTRVYLILAHKLRVQQVHDPEGMYCFISQRIREEIRTFPSDYMIAPKHEVVAEMANIAFKRRLPLTEPGPVWTLVLVFLKPKTEYHKPFRQTVPRRRRIAAGKPAKR